MAPAGRHPDVEKFIFQPRRFCYVPEQAVEFTKIHVEEAAGIDGTGDAVLDLFGRFFILVGPEYPIPYIEQIAKIGIHVFWVAGMVYAVMGGGKDKFLHEAHPGVFHDIFPHMDEGAPGAIDGHDEEEHRWINSCQDTDGGADHIRVGGFQEEMHIGDGEIHALRRVMGRMKAPEEAHFMAKVVIDKMGKLPDDIPINEPVPGKA